MSYNSTAEERKKPPEIMARTFSLALRIIKLCQVLDEKPGVSRTLSRQLLRSGTSIGANMEEAQAGQSRADFHSKCVIALKEARETHYWLRLIQESHLLQTNQLEDLLQETLEISRILGSIAAKTDGGSRT